MNAVHLHKLVEFEEGWQALDVAFSESVVAELVRRLGSGEPLAQICRDAKMPSQPTVWIWSQRSPQLANSIARAREFGYDMIAADSVRIADGISPVYTDDGIQLPSDPQRDKLRVETRLKLLAKWDPKRYGDMQQLRHADADGNKLDNSTLVGEFVALMSPKGAPKAAESSPGYDDISDLI